MQKKPRLFMVWAVCRHDGEPVALVEYRGLKKARELAESMNDRRGASLGMYFVQPRKVQEGELAKVSA